MTTTTVWERSTVADEFEVQLGKRLDAAVNRGELKTCINNRGVRWGKVRVNEAILAPLTEADIRDLRLASGDVLMCEGGEIGRSALWNNEIPEAYFLNTLHRLRSRGRYNPSLLVAFFERWADTGELAALVGKATLAHLTKENLLRVPLPKPTRAEQDRIVCALDAQDDLIATLERLIAKKRAIKQGMMQQLLTGRTRLPDFTEPWRSETLGDLENMGKLKLFRGKVISKLDIAASPGAYPIYSSSVHNHGLFGTFGRYMFDEELITWSVDGGGHFFYRPRHKFSVTNVCGYMRVLSNSISVPFLAYQLQALHSQLHFDYTLKAHPSVIRGAYHVILPAIGEQQAIATALGDIDAEIGALKTRLLKACVIKTGMMQQLLTGRTRLPVEVAS